MFAAMSLEVGVIPQAPPVTGDTRQGFVEDKTGNAVFGVCGIVSKKSTALILFTCSVMALLSFYESECL